MRVQVRDDKSVEVPVELWLENDGNSVLVRARKGKFECANNLLTINAHGVILHQSVHNDYGFKLNKYGQLCVED